MAARMPEGTITTQLVLGIGGTITSIAGDLVSYISPQKCAAAFKMPGMTDWCPPTLIETSQLFNYYNAEVLEIIHQIAKNKTDFSRTDEAQPHMEMVDLPQVIYIDAVEKDGSIRTGTQVKLRTRPKGPSKIAYIPRIGFMLGLCSVLELTVPAPGALRGHGSRVRRRSTPSIALGGVRTGTTILTRHTRMRRRCCMSPSVASAQCTMRMQRPALICSTRLPPSALQTPMVYTPTALSTSGTTQQWGATRKCTIATHTRMAAKRQISSTASCPSKADAPLDDAGEEEAE